MPAPESQPPFLNFRDAFCHHHRCSPEQFEHKVFFAAVQPSRLPLVLVFWVLDRSLFDTDFDIIRALGDTAGKEACTSIMDELHNANRVERSFLRRTMGIRVSGGRLLDLRDELDDLIAERAVVNPLAGASRTIRAPALAPSSSSAATLRKLRQVRTAIIDGQPLAATLRAAGMTEDELVDQLAAHSAGRPEFAWLHGQLARDRRLRETEREIERFKRELAERDRADAQT